MAEKKKRKSASLGCLFWIAFILLVIVLFFLKKDNITTVLEKTGAANLFSGKKNQTELNGNSTEPVVPQVNKNDDLLIIPAPSAQTGDGSLEQKPESPETAIDSSQPAQPEKAPAADSAAGEPAEETKPVPETTVKSVEPKTEKPVQLRKTSLFFVTIDPDGRVLRKEVIREIPKNDSPLSETLNALLKGTTKTEADKGLRSLIPEGTRLLSASVKDGVATLNFSEEFQFNQYGIEGYLGQLAQIVFTATTYSTVNSVQFLIEGQRREYLGAEGVWIGTPLSRDKF